MRVERLVREDAYNREQEAQQWAIAVGSADRVSICLRSQNKCALKPCNTLSNGKSHTQIDVARVNMLIHWKIGVGLQRCRVKIAVGFLSTTMPKLGFMVNWNKTCQTICRSCYFQLPQLWQVLRSLTSDANKTFVHFFCNFYRFLTPKWVVGSSWGANFCVVGKPIHFPSSCPFKLFRYLKRFSQKSTKRRNFHLRGHLTLNK